LFKESMMLIPLLLCLSLSGESHSDVSYVRVLTTEARTEFYRTGGAAWAGSRVHLHVPGNVLRKDFKEYRTAEGAVYHRYDNRSVPLLVAPHNRLYLEVMRRLNEVEVLCVKGRVVPLREERPGRYALLVDSFKRWPGKLEQKGEGKSPKKTPKTNLRR
jgi:hypothetical protein